ncbi:alpha/beta hydrolase [Enterococcus sp. 669A]|uniref:Alpha/beta hydrolase n=1 Tax=Candidatus Enterococcus moelleringii TaxID=2815325 RepID=A0ABS3LBR5_9ENTE|nr:alpha/beta hydrolase [Enterococcus sp. 669A]MBO1307073.1 alpha/beta hydrolase [Enterococcus sp. 669A]
MTYVFVHGLGQSVNSWQETLDLVPLAPVAVPNLDAFLEPGAATYGELYQKFVAYCNQMEEPLHLCGLSLGGILALNYATQFPEKVASLVLMGAQYKMPKKLLKVQNFVLRYAPMKVFDMGALDKHTMLELTTSMMDIDLSADLDKITCPTLVACGSKDVPNKSAALEMTAAIPEAVYYQLEGVGHEGNTEAPEKVAAMLKHFYQTAAPA